jgi:NAD(P)H-hydrate epimerase
MKAITKEQMAELDRIMIEEIGIGVPIMMEHAGIAIASTAAKMGEGNRILVLCGHGNNGGDGLAAARHLINWGYDVKIILSSNKRRLKKDPARQLKILENMKADISNSKDVDFSKYDLIIDALLGYNIKGNPRGRFAELIKRSNNSGKPILAVDMPSGLDATTGKPYNPCIKASVTIALTVLKNGLVAESAAKYVGQLGIAYMSVPDVVYKKLAIHKPFKRSEMILEVV